MRAHFMLVLSWAGLFMAATLSAAPPDDYADLADRGYRSDVVDTDSFKCVILDIRAVGRLKVRNEGEQREYVVALDEDVSIRARFKKDFDGRKKLRPSDLRVGHRIEATRLETSQEIHLIKVLRNRRGDGGP